MKTTTFNCDKCGAIFPSDGVNALVVEDNILCDVKLSINKLGEQYRTVTDSSKHMCRQCLETLGFNFYWSDNTNKKEDRPTYQSLEDKFVELLTELGVKFEE
jgi:hypothetical protein